MNYHYTLYKEMLESFLARIVLILKSQFWMKFITQLFYI